MADESRPDLARYDSEGSKVHTCTRCGWEALPTNTCCGACGGDITETDEGES